MNNNSLKNVNRVSSFQDIIDGLSSYKSWLFLAYQDIISRYRRSILGPFWVAAMMTTQAVALAIVFGTIYGLSLKEFLPHMVTGISVMIYLGGGFNEGTETYSVYKPLVQSSSLPLSFHIFRMCSKQFFVFLHNIVVYLVIYIIFYKALNINWQIIPAILLSFVFIFGTTLFNAILSLRFRDYKFILPHLWTILFFLSPVMWKPEQLKGKMDLFNHANPAYYFLNIFRAGLEGQVITSVDWLGATGFSLLVLAMGYIAFSFTRKQIALWV